MRLNMLIKIHSMLHRAVLKRRLMNHFISTVKSLLSLLRDYERGCAPDIGLPMAPYNSYLITKGVSLPVLAKSSHEVVFISRRKKSEVNIKCGAY